jgi:hypothetical protein
MAVSKRNKMAAQRRSVSQRKRAAAKKALARRLGSVSRARDFLQGEQRRRAELESDAQFVSETEELRRGFDVAYAHSPTLVDSFLRRYRLPSPFPLQQRRAALGNFPPALRALFNNYSRYTSRFGVYFRRRREPAGFEWRILTAPGWKFHARVENAHLQAILPVPAEESAQYYFETPDLQVPEAVEKLIGAGTAKFVQLDDVSGSSVLSELEGFAYHDRGVTFILHRAERPYLFCLIGEKVSKQLLDQAAKGVTAFQQQYYGRGKAGRPRELMLRKKAIELLKQPGRKKEIASTLQAGVSLTSRQSFLSRVTKEQRAIEGRTADFEGKVKTGK